MIMNKTLNIALVAHDSRKKELMEWFTFNINKLCEHNLFATGTTGKLMQNIIDEKYNNVNEYDHENIMMPINDESHVSVPTVKHKLKKQVNCLLSGPLGGDQMIGAMIANGEIDMLIFFCDNLITQGHQQDISALSRLASLYNIAFATNRTTADMLITSPLFGDEDYIRIIPSAIENYANRKL